MAISTGLTIEDFEKLPAEQARGHELVNGELVDVSGNVPEHNGLRDLLVAMLLPYVRERGLGRVIAEQEYKFGDDAHGPDVSFLSPAKAAQLVHRRVQPFVPDFAIEIESPSDSYHGLSSKARKYLRYGTTEVLIISIDEREIIKLTATGKVLLDDNQLLETGLIPGFSIRIGDLLDQI